MTDRNHDDDRLDAAIHAVSSSGPPAGSFEAARRRTLEAMGGSARCGIPRHDLAGLAAGTLPPGRLVLVDAHVRDCSSCRGMLHELRHGPPARTAAAAPRTGRRAALWMGAAAAALVAAVLAWTTLGGGGAADGPVARVADVHGLLLSSDAEAGHLQPGEALGAGQVVRTARGARATIELPDGSLVEMNERSELAVAPERQRTVVALARGEVIVTAAHRRERDLLVRTQECTVAVKGTVFTVGHGLRGSRVGVLEGSVQVDQGRDSRLLEPGQQASTRPDLEPRPLSEQVAWSGRAAALEELLSEIEAVEARLAREAFESTVRHDSRLLDAMPAGTVLHAAVPNSPANLDRLLAVLRERLDANPRLQAWWEDVSRASSAHGAPALDELVDRVQRLSGSLGEEIVAGLVLQGAGAAPVPVLVAEVTDEAQLRALLDEQLVDAASPLRVVDRDALRGLDAAASTEAFIALGRGHVLVGSSPGVLAGIADVLDGKSASGFVGTPFHDKLVAQYQRGTQVLVALDLGGILDAAVARDATADVPAPFRGLDTFVLATGDDVDSAVLSFREDRSGPASWLAEPAPMGALDFVSPDAVVVAAAVLEDPEAMLEDLAGLISAAEVALGLQRFRDATGLDFESDIAAPLGGEIALAVDGPLLPLPAWKLVVEVYDPARLQDSIERLVDRANREAVARAQASGAVFEPVELSRAAGARNDVHVLSHPSLGRSIHYAFSNGYLIACPDAALLERSLDLHALGSSFARSQRLRALMPGGDDHDVSLLVYQDLDGALASLAPGRSQRGQDAGWLLVGRATDREIAVTATSPGNAAARLSRLLRVAALESLLDPLPASPAAAPPLR